MSESFDAYDDAGTRYNVHLIRSYKTGTALDGSSYRVEGLKTYRLSNGQFLNKQDEDTFKIVATGTVTRVKRS